MSHDLVEDLRQQIDMRLKELRPLKDEYERLQVAAAALADVPTRTAPPARRPARTRAPRAANGPARPRRGRPRGGGKRASEVLALVRAQPGIKIPAIAEQLGIKPNYLYRVLPGLGTDGLVTKRKGGWYPAQPSSASPAAEPSAAPAPG